jgi:hypothetical protein
MPVDSQDGYSISEPGEPPIEQRVAGGKVVLRDVVGGAPRVIDAPHYDDFAGATGGADGEKGAVPKPLTAEQDKFLRANGQWNPLAPNLMPYVPGDPGDWPENPDPVDAQEAIDFLAARSAVLGQPGAQVIADTQAVSSQSLIVTSSLTPVDVPGMTLTTMNSGGGSIYVVMFNCEFELNTPNKILFFHAVINGVVEPTSMRKIEISSANSPNNGGTFAWKGGVGNGEIIKIQWWVDAGTASMLGRTLIIQGSQ